MTDVEGFVELVLCIVFAAVVICMILKVLIDR